MTKTTAVTVDVDQIARPEPDRDRYGRYLIPNAGKIVGHTRATTIAKTLDDGYALEKWKMRQVAHGIGLRRDLYALAASHNPETDRKTYDDLTDKALEAAGSSTKAATGTALHRFTEDLDLGQTTIDAIPTEWQAHATRYQTTLDDAGVEIHRDWVELILVDNRYQVAGTTDRIVTLADGRNVIADLKTGANLSYSWLSIAVQLAIYANHTNVFDPGTKKLSDRIPVDTDQGLIIHLPSGGDTCTLHLVDLVAGYEAYMTALEVREMRKNKAIATSYKPLNGGTGGAQAGSDWIRDRVTNLAKHGGVKAVADLRGLWPASVPQPFPQVASNSQVAAIELVLDRVEATHQIPFGLPKPGANTNTNTKEATS